MRRCCGVLPTTSLTYCIDSELLAINKGASDQELSPPLHCISQDPASASQPARKGKRKRDTNGKLLEYFER
ncbi:hypothetical protein UPYG_G00079210 [Umbra pygmaea]|uniref:Uncharacterized protein n=1 Tax=Umbra pygmaea TaxID=75934 RepID=A0ABD0XGG7_UMBPY